MKRTLLLIALAALPLLAVAKVYKWQDEDGRWHYSDTPQPGAVPIDLPPVQLYDSPPLPQSQAPSTQEEEQAPVLSYARAEIVSPGFEETIRNAPGEVGVVLALEPSLRSGHRVQLLLDGQPAAEPVAATAFTLMNVNRGEHQLSAEVLDARGQVVARTGSRTFYMHRPSRLH